MGQRPCSKSDRRDSIRARYDLTDCQRAILYDIVGLENPKGLAIKDELDDYYGSEISHGRLYPNLDTLVEKGLVDKGKLDDRTNEYSLTTRGRREFEARREWEDEYVGEGVEAAA